MEYHAEQFDDDQLDYFAGSGYRIDSHELIGKTGTAQIASEKGGGY